MDTKSPGTPNAEEAKRRAQQGAHELADEAKGRAESIKSDVTDQAERTASALDSAADEFAAEGQEGLAEVLSDLSRGLADLAQRLENKSLDELMQDGGRLAQRNPLLFVAGSVAAGVMLSRFFKARRSAVDRDYDSDYAASSYGQGGSYGQGSATGYGGDTRHAGEPSQTFGFEDEPGTYTGTGTPTDQMRSGQSAPMAGAPKGEERQGQTQTPGGGQSTGNPSQGDGGQR
jgi:hypothetical protein